MILKVSRKPGAHLPRYQTDGAAGMDLCATDGGTIPPLGGASVPTGLHVEIPGGYEGQVRPRSGLAAKHGVTVLNTPGTIDSDYRGEIRVLLVNFGEEPFMFEAGDRIAQLVIAPVIHADVVEVDTLSETERGGRGFGSTGR